MAGDPPKRLSREHRRALLLEGAIATLREQGSAAPMEAIAERAGTTKPGLYRMFGSKRGLYDAIANWYLDQLLGDVIPLIDPSVPFDDFIGSAVTAILDRVHGDQAIYQFLMRRSRLELSPSSTDGQSDYLRMLGDRVTPLMVINLARAGQDTVDAPLLAHGIVGLINAAAEWSLDHPEMPRPAVDSVIAQLIAHGVERYAGPEYAPFPDES